MTSKKPKREEKFGASRILLNGDSLADALGGRIETGARESVFGRRRKAGQAGVRSSSLWAGGTAAIRGRKTGVVWTRRQRSAGRGRRGWHPQANVAAVQLYLVRQTRSDDTAQVRASMANVRNTFYGFFFFKVTFWRSFVKRHSKKTLLED